MQREASAEVFRTRAHLDSSYIALRLKDGSAEKHMQEMYRNYLQIALPSRYQQDRIETIDKDKLKSLKDTLKAAKLSFKKTK
jgi:hypothetical protein